MGARGREYVRGHYDREALATRYLTILHEVAARRPSALIP
jgi:hypothetical protein